MPYKNPKSERALQTQRERSRRWRSKPGNAEKDKERMLRYFRKVRYGVEPETYEAMVEQQRGECASCGVKTRLCIDHNHATGTVRALLCINCNAALGFLKEDAKRADLLACYIRRFS